MRLVIFFVKLNILHLVTVLSILKTLKMLLNFFLPYENNFGLSCRVILDSMNRKPRRLIWFISIKEMMFYFRSCSEISVIGRGQQTFSVKGQIVNVFAFRPSSLFCNYSALLLFYISSHR